MITVAWSIFKASPIARWLAKIGGLVLLVLTFGAYQRNKGAQGQKAKQAGAQAKADRQSHERMNDADLGIGATDSERIERLRDFAAKHGNRPSKGAGGGLR
jgi:hypothetical protein